MKTPRLVQTSTKLSQGRCRYNRTDPRVKQYCKAMWGTNIEYANMEREKHDKIQKTDLFEQ